MVALAAPAQPEVAVAVVPAERAAGEADEAHSSSNPLSVMGSVLGSGASALGGGVLAAASGAISSAIDASGLAGGPSWSEELAAAERVEDEKAAQTPAAAVAAPTGSMPLTEPPQTPSRPPPATHLGALPAPPRRGAGR